MSRDPHPAEAGGVPRPRSRARVAGPWYHSPKAALSALAVLIAWGLLLPGATPVGGGMSTLGSRSLFGYALFSIVGGIVFLSNRNLGRVLSSLSLIHICPYTIRTYDRSIDILMDLMNKRLDAYLREQTRALYQIKNYPMLGVAFHVGDVFVQGVAFRKGDPLRDEYNTILNSMKRDGTLAALYEKWLGTKPGPDSSTVQDVYKRQMRTPSPSGSTMTGFRSSETSLSPSAQHMAATRTSTSEREMCIRDSAPSVRVCRV